jgi:hypothetical protein
MSEPKPLIHIGYHKTATTFLQRTLFARSDLGFECPWTRGDLVRHIVRPGPFSILDEEAREYFASGCRRAVEGNRVPVVSHERLSGYPPSGGYDSREIADRLALVFPNARVLVVIREQQSIIRSWYAQYVRDGGVLSLARFLDPLEPALVRVPQFSFAFYEFDRLVGYYRKVFSAEAVLVLPFELLRSDPRLFVSRIMDLAGLPDCQGAGHEPTNVGLSAAALPFLRLSNRLMRRNQLSPGALVPARSLARLAGRVVTRIGRLAPAAVEARADTRLRKTIADCVGDRYAESNARTSALIGVDLSQLGYPCASRPELTSAAR